MNRLVNEFSFSGRLGASVKWLIFFCVVDGFRELRGSGNDLPYRNQVMVALKGGLPAYGDRKVSEAVVFTVPPMSGDPSVLHFDGPSNVAGSGVVVLKRLVVHESRLDKAVPSGSLTRIPEQKAVKNVKIDPFASDAARNAQLVEKHLSVFDRKVLNRFTLPIFGVSNVARAKQAEAIANSAHQMNTFADMIELTAAEGDREEAKKMREEYYRLFLTRPK
jgi:hypothetical protein